MLMPVLCRGIVLAWGGGGWQDEVMGEENRHSAESEVLGYTCAEGLRRGATGATSRGWEGGDRRR